MATTPRSVRVSGFSGCDRRRRHAATAHTRAVDLIHDNAAKMLTPVTTRDGAPLATRAATATLSRARRLTAATPTATATCATTNISARRPRRLVLAAITRRLHVSPPRCGPRPRRDRQQTARRPRLRRALALSVFPSVQWQYRFAFRFLLVFRSFPARFRRTRRQLDAVVRALRGYVMITATGDPDENDACEGEGLAFDDDDEADQAPPPPPQLKDEMRSCKMAPQSATQKTPRLVPGMGASDLEARWRADDALPQDLRGLLYKLISSDSRLFPLGSAHTSWHPIIIIVYIY